MPDTIGNIAVPEVAASGTFPLTPDWGLSYSQDQAVVTHELDNRAANLKIGQRFLVGTPGRRFSIQVRRLTNAKRTALLAFWENRKGAYQPFTLNWPNETGASTTAYTVRFADPQITLEQLSDALSSTGLTLVEVPTTTPEYALASTETRFPGATLEAALLAQVQEIIPLVKIEPLESGYPAIYLSDRRCTVGAQLYQARLLDFDGINQSMSTSQGGSDDARFVFGNADRVMRDLANDTDLYRAHITFSVFHVGTGVKLDMWSGDIIDWGLDSGPEFTVTATDGLYELRLPYPCRRVSRTCWKKFKDASQCPYGGAETTCNKSFEDCTARGMTSRFGGIIAKPQGVRIRDNGQGGRPWITATSIVNDSIYDAAVPEIYADHDMPVNCLVAAGREESEFYDALGIVGEGPLGAFSSDLTKHRLDGQPNHGPGSLGFVSSLGPDPNTQPFCLTGVGGGDDGNRAAGTAWVEIRRTDQKGIQPSRTQEHQIEAWVARGLGGWYWTDAGTRVWGSSLTNPIWIAVNALLKARGLRYASATVQKTVFDIDSALACAAICDLPAPAVIGPSGTCSISGATVTIEASTGGQFSAGLVGLYLHIGTDNYDISSVTSGTELELGSAPGDDTGVSFSVYEPQFRYNGVISEERPLRDWLQDILNNCLGYYTFVAGKLKFGIRENSSAAEAFTTGNILHGSLSLAPLKPSFNHLTMSFSEQEYEWKQNTVQVYDIDHAQKIGGAGGPLFLKGTMNLCGTYTKSQAGRIGATRVREELGGINDSHRKAARQMGFRTTVLALNVEPGMVCSMTHPDMPGGAGEFRVVGWRLNKDWSIEIQGRTTVDEMYDLTVGPKPADVAADPVPAELAIEQTAPNVTAATATPYYESVNSRLQYGFSGTITLPTASDAYGVLSAVHVVAVGVADGREEELLVLRAPFSGSPLTWRSQSRPRPAANTTWNIEFRAENPFGRISASPYTLAAVTVTGTADPTALIIPEYCTIPATHDFGSGVVANPYVHALVSSGDGQIYLGISLAVTVPATGQFQGMESWIKRGGQNTHQRNSYLHHPTADGATVVFQMLLYPRPTSEETPEIVIASVSPNYAMPPIAGPANCNVRSFTVAAPSTPLATGITNAVVSNVSAAQVDAAGHPTFGFDVTFTTPTTDPNYNIYRLTARTKNGSGVYGGILAAETPNSEDGGLGRAITISNRGPFAFPIPGDVYTIYELKLYSVGFDGTAVLQTGAWPGGADHYDLAAPATNGLDARKLDSGTLGGGLAKEAGTQKLVAKFGLGLTVDGSGNLKVKAADGLEFDGTDALAVNSTFIDTLISNYIVAVGVEIQYLNGWDGANISCGTGITFSAGNGSTTINEGGISLAYQGGDMSVGGGQVGANSGWGWHYLEDGPSGWTVDGDTIAGRSWSTTNLAAKTHTHAQADITNLVSDLAGKASSTHNHDAAYAAIGHTHTGMLVNGVNTTAAYGSIATGLTVTKDGDGKVTDVSLNTSGPYYFWVSSS